MYVPFIWAFKNCLFESTEFDQFALADGRYSPDMVESDCKKLWKQGEAHWILLLLHFCKSLHS
jgi:hypothetical protein